ncbi:thioredoxin-like protein 1 [Tubulanus polymorphus]|uniref:thioredoxin-like protein 1 n=1 Tax=Tubulanus polymorphus TaxID=672921 RepID=UPI003DA3E5C2
MSGNLKVLNDDAEFQTELNSAGSKLVVVDFFATWCGPCHQIAPVFEGYATKYSNAVFLKVDVDKLTVVTNRFNITAMPTFTFFKNKVKVDEIKGADPVALEEKIKKHYQEPGESDETVEVKGHIDLSKMIQMNGSECLNESDDHTLKHALSPKGGYLQSDCDEQLIISLEFSQPVKLHSLKMYAPDDGTAPKTIKLFTNRPQTLDFDSAESMDAIQKIQLTPDDVKEGTLIPLRYVKFQNVSSVSIFVNDNQGGEETTVINYLGFIGSPVMATNMSDFKRVAGKKGESH